MTSDLPSIKPKDGFDTIGAYLETFWSIMDLTKTDKLPSASRTLIKSIKWPMIGSVVANLFLLFFTYSVPVFLGQIVDVLQGNPVPMLLTNDPIGLAFILFGLQMGTAIAMSVLETLNRRIEQNMQLLMVNAIYSKSFRISPKLQEKYDPGNIMTMIEADMMLLLHFSSCWNSIWTGPANVIITIVLLTRALGVATLGGVAILIFSLLISSATGGVVGNQFKRWLEATDLRTGKLREILMGIKVIKFLGLEEFYLQQLQALRKSQFRLLLHGLNIVNVPMAFISMVPSFMPVIAFGTLTALGLPFNASIVFQAILLFSYLMAPLRDIENLLRIGPMAAAGWKRVNAYLLSEETRPDDKPVRIQDPHKPAIVLKDAVWSYETIPKEDKPEKSNAKVEKSKESGVQVLKVSNETLTDTNAFKLEDLTMDIQKGSLVGVVGAVGSGKTTLLSGLIGQVRKTAGEAIVNGSLAYCSQTPWIVAGSVERNITFDAPVDEERLDKVIKASSLMSDLNKLKDGIKTEIGENGVNLSGGQKARVALARALYRDADIYLMDDPVAALDAQVGRQVFTRAIKQELKDKTVLFVTHQLQFLQEMDQIIVLDEGKVSEFGSFEELKSKNGVFTKLMEGYAHEEHDHQEQDEEKEEKKEDVSKFMDDEERRRGHVESKIVWNYFKRMGPFHISNILIVFLAFMACGIASPFWLTIWSAKVVEDPSLNQQSYFNVYAIIESTSIFYTTMYGPMAVSLKMEDEAITKVMHSPMHFFDSNPVGRVINRLTSDVQDLDLEIGGILLNGGFAFTQILITIVLICQSNLYLLILMFALCVILYFIFQFYQPSNRELKRMISLKRSPYMAHISETLSGTATLKAYGLEQESLKQLGKHMNAFVGTEFLHKSLGIWLNLRLSAMASLVTLVVVLLAAISNKTGNAQLGAQVGLSITFSLKLTKLWNTFISQLGSAEAAFNAVERLDHYCNNLELEAPHHLPDDDRLEKWPTHGKVEFQDLQVAYPSRPDHLVIKNLSMTVQPGEKIGVVGRTGSGKSTLMTALFRVVEPHSGTVLIDGKDIRKLGLHTLRSRMQMIPQEPVLFSGTVRSNLDLESKFTDEQLWDALDLVGLKGYVESQNEKLEMPVSSGGENISAGQRQLICLARAILQQPKIMVMDEATAAVDQESNKLIQEAIKTQFKHTTVIAIAHRLNTIAGYDRVLVLQDGEVAEFDRPHLLLQNPDSLFTQLTDASGPSNAQIIRDIALEKYKSLV
ncbi:P-loop containing nucleoside triphosphate hydrolase protein [Gorgonomyces haynaldii]|nr:P-loop containing nucleoside triphosphate hydrolase protein [Gorgonomyces haynaldii]